MTDYPAGLQSQIVQAFTKSLVQDARVVAEASSELSALLQANEQGFFSGLCEVMCAATPQLKRVCAIYLKNQIRTRWSNEADDPIGSFARTVLKQSLARLIFSCPEEASYIIEAIEVMAETDFPFNWPELLAVPLNEFYKPFILNSQAADITKVVLAVTVVEAAFHKYSRANRSTDTLKELKALTEEAQEPIFLVLCRFATAYKQLTDGETLATPERASLVIKACRASVRTVEYFNSVDLVEYFEDNLDPLVHSIFALVKPVPALIEETDSLQIACCELMESFITKYSGEYMPYVVEGTSALLELLLSQPNKDSVTSAAMSCLAVTAKVIWGPECNPFLNIPDLVPRLCREIIARNAAFRPEELLEAEEAPLEFIRHALEGGEHSQRRETAAHLLQNLMRYHDAEVIANVPAALGASAAMKEASIFLVTAMSTKAATREAGATDVYRADTITTYLQTTLLPLLKEPVAMDNEVAAIPKCAALKYIAHFRNFISPECLHGVVPLILVHLQAEKAVLAHTVAAYTLEKLLTVKRSTKAPYLNVSDAVVQTCLTKVLDPLLQKVKREIVAAEAEENEYTAKCFWRCASVARVPVTHSASSMMALIELMPAVQTSNPAFVHFLIESICSLAKTVSLSLPSQDQTLELHRIVSTSIVKLIMADEAHPFVPYYYQVLTALVSSLPEEATPVLTTEEWCKAYQPLLDGILTRERWSIVSNIPGIMAVLVTLLRRKWLFWPILKMKIPAMLDGYVAALNQRTTAKARRLGLQQAVVFLSTLILCSEPSAVQPHMQVLTRVQTKILSQYINRPKDYFAGRVFISVCLMILYIEAAAWQGTRFGQTASAEEMYKGVAQQFADEGGIRAFAEMFSEQVSETLPSSDRMVLLAFAASFMTNPAFRDGHPIVQRVLATLSGLQEKESVAREVPKEDDEFLPFDMSGTLEDVSVIFNRVSVLNPSQLEPLMAKLITLDMIKNTISIL